MISIVTYTKLETECDVVRGQRMQMLKKRPSKCLKMPGVFLACHSGVNIAIFQGFVNCLCSS